MGNLPSCTTCLLSSTTQSPAMVRVLLVNGRVLKFKAPLKVMELLLEYPNHVICCLNSLRPGLHSLSSLLPHEKLQLGGLYLLLPSTKSHMQPGVSRHKRQQPMMQKSCASNDKFLQAKVAAGAAPDQYKRSITARNCTEVGMASGAEFRRNGDLGRRYPSCPSELKKDCNVGREEKNELLQRRRYMFPAQKKPRVAAEIRRGKRSREGELRRREDEKQHAAVANGRRSCSLSDTPELQRAYHLSVLRRRRSTSQWTPTLQPINERS